MVIASRKESIREYARELTERGKNAGVGGGICHAVTGVDVGTEAGINKLVDEVGALFSSSESSRRIEIDVLINNSGTNYNEPVETQKMSMFKKVIDLNLSAAFGVTQAFIPMLRRETVAVDQQKSTTGSKQQQEYGRVINITSINGLAVPDFETYAYSASKAGLDHLTRHLASKLVSENILVNAVAPGMFESRMTRGVLKMGRHLAEEHVPVNRIGRPQDIGGACLFLASDAGTFMCGASITLDGGQCVKTILSSKL